VLSESGAARWRRSSRSGGEGTQCVEIASTLGAVRDSKNATGPTLNVDVSALVTKIKIGQFD
jgi:hypothetical protein